MRVCVANLEQKRRTNYRVDQAELSWSSEAFGGWKGTAGGRIDLRGTRFGGVGISKGLGHAQRAAGMQRPAGTAASARHLAEELHSPLRIFLSGAPCIQSRNDDAKSTIDGRRHVLK